MTIAGKPTLDHLEVLLCVVETGSFAAAARRLRRATSAVSYAIATLEAVLGVLLFDRHSTRKPRLTSAGAAIVAKARVVNHGVDDLRANAKSLIDGFEAEVSLVVDVMLPTTRLVDAVQAFDATYPTIRLRLHVEALSAVTQLVRSGAVALGIGGGEHTPEAELEKIHVGDVSMIPVASHKHPLARGVIAPGEASRHRQIVLTVRAPFAERSDVAVFGADAWRVADLGAKHALLLAGTGWGNMPEQAVRGDIAAGRLVRLDVPEGRQGVYPLHAMYRSDNPPGKAGRWLIQRFQDQAADAAAVAHEGW